MKFSNLMIGVILFWGLISCDGGDKIPAELQAMLNSSLEVPVYKSFEEIPAIKPIPAKSHINIFTSSKIEYSLLEVSEYNENERELVSFLEKNSMTGALKMVTYARQLNINHPYRINPYLPFLTYRQENVVLSSMGFGPAAVVDENFWQRNMFKGVMPVRDFSSNIDKNFYVEISPRSLPMTGLMFLFDLGDLLKIEDVIKSDQNLLEDVIYHEFTHVWHNELLSKEIRDRINSLSNETDTGHDAMIVSNKTLAFIEGLAESTEALFGTYISKNLQMSAKERENFFGRFSKEIQKNLVFLKNRQNHIRNNSYVYNLYDFSKCLLRKTTATDAENTPVGKARIMAKIQELLLANKNVTPENLETLVSDFTDRFYGGSGELSSIDLMDNCVADSPARLEAKEGFVGSLIYNLVYSGALVPEDYREGWPVVKSGGVSEAKELLANHINSDSELWTVFNSENGRVVAEERKQKMKRLLMIGFRELVLSLKESQAINVQEWLHYLLNEGPRLSNDVKMGITYNILKLTHAKFTNDKKLKQLFDVKTPSDLKKNREAIVDYLVELAQLEQLDSAIELMGAAPEVLVKYQSSTSGSLTPKTTKMNINRAYHINLIEIFGINSPAISQLAKKMDNGFFFKDRFELLAFATTIGKEDRIRKLLEDADAPEEVSDVAKFKKCFSGHH